MTGNLLKWSRMHRAYLSSLYIPPHTMSDTNMSNQIKGDCMSEPSIAIFLLKYTTFVSILKIKNENNLMK